MQFRTSISTIPFDHKIDHSKYGFSLGSCFAESIARKLQDAKFGIVSNPFGILYNPVSIADTIHILDQRRQFTEADLVRDGDLWHSFSFHGNFSSTDAGMTLAAMNRAVVQGAEALSRADYVIITLGTAWVYELADGRSADPRIVANCHKFPASMFRRRRLSVDEIVTLFKTLLQGPLKAKSVIMTTSPIRHLKDGLSENTISKASLNLAINELTGTYENTVYFPSFEIMNDDLRDYRFYREDMLHPTDQAIEYIWEVFSRCAFSQKTAEAAERMEKISAAARHRPFNPDSESHERFMKSMAESVRQLQQQYPQIDLSGELSYFEG